MARNFADDEASKVRKPRRYERSGSRKLRRFPTALTRGGRLNAAAAINRAVVAASGERIRAREESDGAKRRNDGILSPKARIESALTTIISSTRS